VGAGRVRARRGSGSVRVRNGRLLAQVSLGTDPSGRRIRRGRTFGSRPQAEAWIATQQPEHGQLTNPVTDERLADYLRWWPPSKRRRASPGGGLGLRWRDLDLTSMPPRLTVVWQLDR
jgi:hypothetical protein